MKKKQDLLEDILKKECFQIVQKILRDESKVKIFLFGSRATGHGTLRSDIDLGIDLEHNVSPQKMVLIREAFDCLPLFQKIDIVDFFGIDLEFKKVALRKTSLLYERKVA